MLFFILFWLVKSNESNLDILYGNWSDSSILDETIYFFNYTNPEHLDKVKKILANSAINHYTDVIESLKGHFSKELLGLLKLSLAFRYFHPQSVIQNKNSEIGRESEIEKFPILRGWGATIKNSISNYNMPDFKWKFLNYVYSSMDSEERLQKLSSVLNPSSNFPRINQLATNHAIAEEFRRLSLEKNPAIKDISLINGRVVSNDAHDILDALINEYQTVLVLKELGISQEINPSLFDKILYGAPEKQVFEYIPPLEKVPILERHEAGNSRAKWGPKLQVNETSPLLFLRNERQMVKTQIFINIHSKESAPILDQILEETIWEYPYGYEVALIADLNNETEKRIAFSFLTCLMNIGTRSSIEYLLDGILHGYEKAYKKTRPVFAWKDLLDEPAFSTIYKFVKKQHDYADKYGINDFAIIVNGQVIREKPSFTEMKYHILDQGKRLLNSAQRGFFNESTNLDDFLSKNGIPVKSVEKPLEIEMNNRISINSWPINSIIELVRFLGQKLTKKNYFQSSEDEKTSIPVYYLDCKPPPIDDLHFDSPSFVVHVTSKKKGFPESALKAIRGAKTIVGPLIFDKPLSASELRYALYYVKLSFMELIEEENLNHEQLLFILFWRSTLGLRGIDRRKNPAISTSALIHKTSEFPLTWYSIMNPFSKEYRMTIEMINQVSSFNLASIYHIPSVPLDPNAHISTDRFIPVIFSNGVNTEDADYNDVEIEAPHNWAIVRQGNRHIVTHVVTYGFAFGSDRIAINNEVKFPLKKNGYFISLLPIGEYQVVGVRESSYVVDTLLPRPRFYSCKKELTSAEQKALHSSKQNEYLNVFSFTSSYEYENITRMMLYSMVSNTTRKIKLWHISGFRKGNPKGIETQVLSRFWPHFLARPKDPVAFCKAAKFVLPDLIFPADVENVLFVDQEIVFRGDVSVFEKVNLTELNSALAVPLISSNPKAKNLYWNQRQSIVDRFKRPFHNTALCWMNLANWRAFEGGELYRDLFDKIVRNEAVSMNYDNGIVSMLQMRVQIASLPKETIYCSSYSKKEFAKKPFAILQVVSDLPGVLGKEYDELLNAAVKNLID